ncbi:hypothetical protein BSKO_06052 [Bryopsis sp. KO-2023]|nr:hypothetical protein BSKO_06052 [Bryopsis sp. KO-2023]
MDETAPPPETLTVPRVDVDLSCVMFSGDGKLLECVNFGNPKGVQDSVIHSRGNEDKETVEICPSRVLHDCEVLGIVLSAADSPVRKMDLGSVSGLKINIYSSEKNKPQEVLSCLDLTGKVSTSAPTPNPFSDGHQSLVVCMLYRVGNGWHINLFMDTHPHASWGDILPEMKMRMKTISELEGMESIEIDEDERVVQSRPNEERTVSEASYQREMIKQSSSTSLPSVSRLRIDVGWAVTDPEAEDVAVEFNCAMLGIDGEEIQAVSVGNPEAEGAKVEEKAEEPEPEEPEEAEGEEDEEAEESAAEEEAKPDSPPEPPVNASIFLTFNELPQDVKSIVLSFNNFGGSGLAKVKTIYARMQDVTDPENPRDCSVYTFSGSKEHKKSTGLVVFKVFKEFKDNAYWWWRGADFRTLGEFSQKAHIKALMSAVLQGKKEYQSALAAAKAAEEAGEEDVVLPKKDFEWRVRVPAVTFPGESGEDHQPYITELAAFEGVLTADWLRDDSTSKVVFPTGDSFFGGYKLGKKDGLGFYVFANGGSYIGNYSNGKRSEEGVMMMPDGGVYKGQFSEDKFHGEGAYFYPDGSCYIGVWENGSKAGAGVYWDKDGGCLRGAWSKGVLKGEASYDQPSYCFKGNFVKGIPEGSCTFTVHASRTLDLPPMATSFILSDDGPTLTTTGRYDIPPGAGTDAPEGEEAPEDQPPMPKAPNYEGLSFTPSRDPPSLTPDIHFPPAEAPQPPSISAT